MTHKILMFLLLSSSIITARYYSQPCTQQDAFFDNFFKGMKNGFFVDIGAHDGISHSNTYFFEKERNWNGICFEPLSKPFEKLQKTRSCICINACVSSKVGVINFIKVEGAPEMLSGIADTYDQQERARLEFEIQRDGGSFEITSVPSVRFNDVMKQHNVTHVDLLSIDVEGGEMDILRSINFEEISIYAICIEAFYGDYQAIRPLLESKGFTYITKLGNQDEIYINYANQKTKS